MAVNRFWVAWKSPRHAESKRAQQRSAVLRNGTKMKIKTRTLNASGFSLSGALMAQEEHLRGQAKPWYTVSVTAHTLRPALIPVSPKLKSSLQIRKERSVTSYCGV